MGKIILSLIIFAVGIIAAIILYNVVANNYSDFWSFGSLIFMGLITFGLALFIILSAVILEAGIRENKK